MKIQGLDPKAQAWLNQFNEAMQDPERRQQLINDPLASFEQLGLAIDPAQQAALRQSLQSAAMAASFEDSDGATALKGKQSAKSLESYFHWRVEFWGFVMRIDHEAIKQLPTGTEAIGTLAAAAFGVVKAAGAIGPTAVVVALGLVYWGAIFTAYVVTLPLLDQGKGVYLTISYPQLAIAAASGGLLGFAALPVPTTVV